MTLFDQIIVLSLIFTFVVAVERLIKPYKIPFNIILVMLGFVASELALLFVNDLQIRWVHIRDIIFYLLIPVILFQTVFKLDFRLHRRDLMPFLLLAFPMNLVTILLISGLVYFLIGNASGFPFHSALLAGTLLATTSPATMGILLKQSGASAHISTVMIGEALFNGVISITLFMYLLSIQPNELSTISLPALSWQFAYGLILATIIGLAVGLVMSWLLKFVEHGYRYAVVSVAACFVSYYLAVEWVHAFGTVAVLASSLLILHFMQKKLGASCQTTQGIWDFLRYLAGIILYLLMGVSITFALFGDGWLAMLIGIMSVFSIRAVVVYGILPLIERVGLKLYIQSTERKIMWLGAMRGGTTIALALSIPETIEGWWTIQAIAYGAVLFSLSVQHYWLPKVINAS